MPPRLYVDQTILGHNTLTLPAAAARHVQVLRLQPGAALTLFNGQGGEWSATVLRMGRSDVEVQVTAHSAVEREVPLPVTLALGMPANERMDALVEKATELGVAAIQPLLCERSVLRLSGERAEKRITHWRGVAVAACEQSGRTRVPRIAPVLNLAAWLQALGSGRDESRLLLSLRGAALLAAAAPAHSSAPLSPPSSKPPSLPLPALNPGAVLCLSGPEGGLTEAEEAAAKTHGFTAVSLGARVLRADTAPLALLAHLALTAENPS